MAENEKKEAIVYNYPGSNPYTKHGRLNVGYVEYKHKGFKVYLPLPRGFLKMADDGKSVATVESKTVAQLENAIHKIWGPHCSLATILTKFTRSVGNNIDNTWGAVLKGCEERGEDAQAQADALQKSVDGYEVGAPREAKSAKEKEEAAKMRAMEEQASSMINPATGKAFTMEEVMAAAAAIAQK